MTTPVLVVFAVIVSAVTRVRLPVLGPTPVLGVIALGVVLALVAVVLAVVRILVRDGLRLRPVMS